MIDTRHVVYQPLMLTPQELENGYHWAYNEFYKWNNVLKAAFTHDSFRHQLKHLFYTGGWKKFEDFWSFIINSGGLQQMLPLLELLLCKVEPNNAEKHDVLPLERAQRAQST